MEAGMNLYDHKYMRFMLKDDRLDFVWKAETEDMDDHGFQYSILRYASYVMEYNFKKVLIDLTDFKFSPAEASGKFHSDYVTKIYNMVGVTKKVFVAPFMDNKVVGKEPGTDYDNAFMKSYDEAVHWLDT
jgi:hypothetical protein